MKKLLLAFCVLIILPAQGKEIADEFFMCKLIAKYAETFMTARQQNIPKSKVDSLIGKEPDEKFKKVLKHYVALAYDAPVQKTPKLKQLTIDIFKKAALVNCLDLVNEV